MQDILAGKRVLDISEGIAGAYCTKLFVDAGADVVKVERASGDPMRQRGSGGLFKYLHAGKKSVCGDWEELASQADLVVASRSIDSEALRSANPRLVILSITPFGATGPWADRPANEFILQAWCGSTGNRGWPDEEPLSAGGELGFYMAGVFAAVAALSALLRAECTGNGEAIDASILESMAIGFVFYNCVAAQFENSRGAPTRSIDIPAIEAAEDGYVALTTVTAAQFDAFLKLIGREDLARDKDLASRTGRHSRYREFQTIIDAFTATQGVDAILAKASALRIPAAPVTNGATVRDIEHFRRRGIWLRDKAGIEQPGPAYRLDGQVHRRARTAPLLGEHDGAIGWEAAASSRASIATPASADNALPLAGIRVIDCTAFWAGPMSSLFLAALGADVIHIEGPDRFDPNRLTSNVLPNGQPAWNAAPRFLAVNNSKRSFVVDLKKPEGVALTKRLLATADVLLENNSPRVMDALGLGWDDVRRVNPALVMTRLSGFGVDGPWRENVAYAYTAEAVSSLAWVTGRAEGRPTVIGGPGDPLAGAHAAFATVLALFRRKTTGKGGLVDSCLTDAALAAAAEQTIEWQATGILSGRHGNRSPSAAPQGLYPCAGDDRWIAISVETDEEWLRLKKVIGDPALEADVLLEAQGRHDDHNAIDAAIRCWAARKSPEDAVASLLDEGVMGAVVTIAARIGDNPQMQARSFFERMESKSAGNYETPIMPFRFASVERWSRRPAPDLGEHTEEILDELEIDSEARTRLRNGRVIA